MPANRTAVAVVGCVLLSIGSAHQARAIDRPNAKANPSSDSDNDSPVPARIAPVNDEVAFQYSQFHDSFWRSEGRDDFDSALHNLEAQRSLVRQHFGEGHYLVRRSDADLLWHNWNTALTDQQRSDLHKATDFFVTAVQLEDGHEMSKAAENYRKGLQFYLDANSPPTAEIATMQLHFANALCCCSGDPQEAAKEADRAFDFAIKSEGQFSPLVASALRTQATAYTAIGKYSLSLHKASRACRISAACQPDFATNQETGDNYDNLYVWCFKDFCAVKSYDRASQCLNELKKLRTQRKPVDNLKLCEIKDLEYLLLDATDRHKEALEKAEEWLDFAQRLFTSDSSEVEEAKTASAEALLKLNDVDAAVNRLKELVRVKLKSNPKGLEASWLTDVYSELMIAKNRDQDGIPMLETRIEATDGQFDVCDTNLCDLLKAYVTALKRVGRQDEAKAVEERIASIGERLDKMRREVEADPQCKFPWEN